MPSVTRSHGRWKVNYATSAAKAYKTTHIASVNASQFLGALIEWSDFVGVKLDVEGYEFSLLPNILSNSPGALCGLDLLAVEWHRHAKNASRLEHTIKKQLGLSSCNPWLLDWA